MFTYVLKNVALPPKKKYILRIAIAGPHEALNQSVTKQKCVECCESERSEHHKIISIRIYIYINHYHIINYYNSNMYLQK